MIVILLGPPGAGKGTQAVRISAALQIPHISTGDMLRAAMRDGTPTGLEAKGFVEKGLLVPDGVVLALVRERLAEPDCKTGALLDGFPRTIEQAEALSAFAKVDAVINLSIADQKIVERLSCRRYCPACGHTAGRETLIDGKCPVCGAEMCQRTDDCAETILNRLDVYARQTRPLTEYYARAGLLKTIDGDQSVEDTFRDAMAALRAQA